MADLTIHYPQKVYLYLPRKRGGYVPQITTTRAFYGWKKDNDVTCCLPVIIQCAFSRSHLFWCYLPSSGCDWLKCIFASDWIRLLCGENGRQSKVVISVRYGSDIMPRRNFKSAWHQPQFSRKRYVNCADGQASGETIQLLDIQWFSPSIHWITCYTCKAGTSNCFSTYRCPHPTRVQPFPSLLSQ